MKDTIRVIVKMPHEDVGHIEIIKNEWESLRKLVGGFIELARLTGDMGLLCNEEGLINNLPINCEVAGFTFFGTIIAIGIDGENFTDVPISLGDWEKFIIGR